MLLRLLATVLVAAVCLAGMAIFFRITEIQVAGNQIYTAEQVVEASGLTVGENLLTIQKRTASGRIMAALPYVSAVHMERVLPSTVVITVTESDAAYLVEAEDGSQWLMSSGGRLLEEAGVTAADYPQLVGFLVQAPEVGAQAASEQAEKPGRRRDGPGAAGGDRVPFANCGNQRGAVLRHRPVVRDPL